ncbi:hypothetical protein KI387_035784 [Taxus chinensis]|uniref:DUF7812 domain-containing protein n=1 Tax=Taxus chinensis TaxID=29808 RepID=A0AA38FRX0_TAXCH|nr:hypothetical protein KI387_035784 [Taxus chinensis]
MQLAWKLVSNGFPITFLNIDFNHHCVMQAKNNNSSHNNCDMMIGIISVLVEMPSTEVLNGAENIFVSNNEMRAFVIDKIVRDTIDNSVPSPMQKKMKGGNTEENGGRYLDWQQQVALNSLQAQPCSQSHVYSDHWKDLSCYYSALISDPQVSKAHILEPLSCLLLCLSSALSSNNFDCPDNCSISACISGIRIRIKLDDIQLLYNLLFQELFDQVKTIFAIVNYSSDKFASNNGNYRPCHTGPDDTILLLRCSIRILSLLEFDTGLSPIATTRLASLFHELCSPSLVRTVLGSKAAGDFGFVMTCEVSCCMDGSMSFASSKDKVKVLKGYSESGISGSDDCSSVRSAVQCLCALLEVFVDELILHRSKGKTFLNEDMESTGLFSRSKTTSICGKHIEHSFEAVFFHCLLSMSRDKLLDTFLHKLYDPSTGNARGTRISLPAAVLLLDSLVLIGAPKIFQAHVLVLVSEVVAVDSVPTYGELSMELSLGQHVSVFESAIELYRKHSSLVDTGDGYDGLESLLLGSCLIKYRYLQAEFDVSSDSVINLMWNEKDCIHQHNCNSSHQSSSTRNCQRHSSSLLKSLCMYIKEEEESMNDLSRKEINGILYCILNKAFFGLSEGGIPSCAHTNVHPDTYLLAAILQLMGCSLSRIVCITREKGDSSVSTPLGQYLLQAYHYTIGLVVNCIGQCPCTQPIGIALNKIMAEMLASNKQSVGPAVSYFVGELYLKFQMGSELLCKGYVFVLKSLMSLFVLEPGGIDSLRALMESSELSVDSCDSTSDKVLNQGDKLVSEQMVLRITPRLVPVLVNFLRKRQRYSSCCGQDLGDCKEEVIDPEEDTDLSESIVKSGKACSNNAYIQSVIRGSEDPGDLSDFIVCKEGKDYSAWLKKRCKIRQKKYQRNFLQRMKNRKELLAVLSVDN